MCFSNFHKDFLVDDLQSIIDKCRQMVGVFNYSNNLNYDLMEDQKKERPNENGKKFLELKIYSKLDFK